VAADTEALRFNTAIAKMMEFVNCAKKQAVIPHAMVESFVLILAPFSPHVAEELWERLGHKETLAFMPFPKADPAWLKDDEVTIVFQVNSKKRAELTVPKDASEANVQEIGKADAKVQAALAGKEIVKSIFVTNRIWNVIVKG